MKNSAVEKMIRDQFTFRDTTNVSVEATFIAYYDRTEEFNVRVVTDGDTVQNFNVQIKCEEIR